MLPNAPSRDGDDKFQNVNIINDEVKIVKGWQTIIGASKLVVRYTGAIYEFLAYFIGQTCFEGQKYIF